MGSGEPKKMTDDGGPRAVWFLTGAALGAAIALLYAPKTGEETRRIIGEKTKVGRAALSDQGEDLMAKGRELYDKGRRLVDDAADMFDQGKKIVGG
jgi:gas vesicle protein